MKHFTTTVTTFFLLTAVALGYGYFTLQIEHFIHSIAILKGSALTAEEQDKTAREMNVFLSAVADESHELQTFVVRDAESLRIINAIENAAKNAQVDTTIASVSVLQSGWTYHDRVEVIVSTRASFDAVAHFAALLEAMPTASLVEQVSLEASANHTWRGTYTVDFIKEKASIEKNDSSKTPASNSSPTL